MNCKVVRIMPPIRTAIEVLLDNYGDNDAET